MEVRPFGIRVVIVEPGVILTPIWGKRDIALPEGHAYEAVMERLMRIFAPQFEGGTPPDVVAEAIWGAATRPGTPVHLLVGPDAECLVAARQRMTPDEWVSVMSEPDDDRFVARLTEACGDDIFSSPSLYARRQRLEAFARDYTAAWCSQDATRVASFFEDDGSLTINDGPPAVGRPAITADAQGFMTAFPDLMVALDRLEFDRDVVRYHWTLTGTNSGPGGTGQQVRISGHETWTFGSLGRIARSQGAFDAADYQQQLGGA